MEYYLNKSIRDTISYVVGIGGIIAMIYAWIRLSIPPSPYLLAICGWMIGLPGVLQLDDLIRYKRNGGDMDVEPAPNSDTKI